MLCKSTCAETDTDCQKKEQESGDRYKNCSCICGKFYYFSDYYKLKLPIVGEVKVGEQIRNLAKPALVSLVNNVLGTDDLTMDQLICSVFDAVQFVEFTGTVDLAKDTGKSTYSGKFIYSGIVPPKVFGVELDSKLSVIKGTWQEASIINDKDLFAFKTMQLNFSYGNLIYDILNKFIVKSEDGDVLNFINCESIFSSGISLPIIGGFEAKDLQSLCNSFKSTISGQAVDLADSQNVSLNIKVDGQATLEGESENIGGKIYAQNLVKGKWDGTGVVKGENYNISGLWYGSRSEDNLGELSYDLSDEAEATDLDSWKAARSICRSSIDASRKGNALNNADAITNQLCLGGTFDVAGRDANNLCSINNAMAMLPSLSVKTTRSLPNSLLPTKIRSSLLPKRIATPKLFLIKTRWPKQIAIKIPKLLAMLRVQRTLSATRMLMKIQKQNVMEMLRPALITKITRRSSFAVTKQNVKMIRTTKNASNVKLRPIAKASAILI